jgi:hypothetical protein
VQKASGKKFQDLLEEVFVRPIGLNGEFYIGIPAGMHLIPGFFVLNEVDYLTDRFYAPRL